MSHPIRITLLLGIAACGGGSSVSRAPTEPQLTADEPLPDDVGQLEQLCLGGRLDACRDGGRLSEDAEDTAKARDFYWFACLQDDAQSCGWLATLEADPIQNRVLDERACRLGDGSSCSKLGWQAEEAQRYDEAEHYYQLACDNGDDLMDACGLAERLRNR